MCLLRIAQKWSSADVDGEIRLDAGLSQADLGDFSGLARENVNRTLRALADEGAVRLDGRQIVIADPESLTEIAEL